MFTHLHVRSSYTLLESTIYLEKLVKNAKSKGFDAISLTDHNVMYGAAEFEHICNDNGIKPIFGLEIDCLYKEIKVPFLLIAKDNKGFHNLMNLSSIVNIENRPCTIEELKQYSKHNYIIVYGEGGYFDSELVSEDRDLIKEKILELKDDLSEFYVAISFQESSLWRMKNNVLKRICKSLNIKTVALNKVYYLEKEDEELFRILTGIRQQKTILDQTLLTIPSRYLLSYEEMINLYDKEDLDNVKDIVDNCNVSTIDNKASLPKYPIKENISSAQYLTQYCLAGLKKRKLYDNEAIYLQRLRYELDVIIKMHYEDYFLIVWDFIKEAKKKNIYVGPGRGSAAGSLVAYCLGITQVDPIRYNLLFERFLNPERISLPDIDVDIPDEHRQEVIKYVHDKYGDSHVANIITFGSLGARQVLRDVGKVLNMNTRDIDMLVKLIPNNPKITLEQALEQNKRLKQIVEAEEKYATLFKYALQLEGLPRHSNIHAAGIVLSDRDIKDIIPLSKFSDDILTSQYTMGYLEERGLIKMDFLSLRNLSIIEYIYKEIQKTNPDFNIFNIPLDDEKVYKLFSDANTLGVFQFESEGMKNLLKRIKPNSFNDIVASLALYRPSAMESIPTYLANKESSHIEYIVDDLKDILKDTYGVMVYQEQAMQTTEVMADFSLGKADILRKAISKKNDAQLQSLKNDFISGCLKNGYSTEVSEKVFSLIERFGGYGFNKSHAVAYSLISYQMAYLKVNYPNIFYCAVLDGVIGDSVKTMEYLNECKSLGLKVLGPNVITSKPTYYFDDGLHIPLSVIKGISSRDANSIYEENQKQQFVDYFDFIARASIIKINRGQIVSLIHAGALDCFGLSRETMIQALDDALNYAELSKVENNGLISMNFDLVSKPTIVKYMDNLTVNAENEKEVLGFTIGKEPIELIKENNNINVNTIAKISKLKGQVDGFAQITRVHQHRTKKGDLMAFLRLTDETGDIDMAVMPKLYLSLIEQLAKGKYIYFHGKIDDNQSILAERIVMYNEIKKERH